MVLRIRFARAGKLERRLRKNRRLALAMGSLLVPTALMASVLGLWRLAADLKITGDFAISTGLLSHWQVWIASAVVLLFVARTLDRYGRGAGHVPNLPGSSDRLS